MRFRRHLGPAFFATSAAALILQPAAAQEAPTDDLVIDVVVVTAQKREQNLFDVPMSVSAVSGDEIAERGAVELEDLQYTVPGLSIAQLAPGSEQIELRGISVFSGLPTVGVYLDELPLNGETGQAGLDVRLVDMERVEVLRGPQGTLYGQGAVGGTIRYITKAPDLEAYAANVTGEVATIADGGVESSVQGAISIPIVKDQFAVRIAAAHQEFGGWIDNTTTRQEDNNAGSTNYLRALALWKPTEKLDVNLLLVHQELDLDSINLSDANRTFSGAAPTPSDSQADIANLTITYDLGIATVLSSSGWVDRTENGQVDLSPLFIPALEAPPPAGFGYPSGTFTSIAYQTENTNRFFAQELRLTSSTEGPLSWTVGAMYRDSESRTRSKTVNTPDIVPVDLLTTNGTQPSDSVSWSVFGEATWALSPALEATVGGRYFEDERTQDIVATTFGGPSSDKGKETFSAFSPRVNLMWRPSDEWNLFANIAKGFRSGGFNRVSAGFGIVAVPPTYKPDTLWSYEFGGRYRAPDRRLQAEFSIYYNDWSDVQSLEFATAFPAQYIVNGNDISGIGIDAAVEFRATDSLRFGLSGGYNDMTYQRTTGERKSGDPADYVPQYTLAASATYDFRWAPKAPGYARLDYQLTDGWQVFPRNVLPAPVFADAQRYLNARLGVDLEHINVSLFADNIMDEDGVTYPAFGGLFTPMRPQPRTVGLTLSYNY
jgi:iron complex outermembrane receptor protein